MKRKKITFIINPVSGIGKHKAVEKRVERFLNKDIYEPHILYLTKEKDIETLSREAALNGSKVVVAVGGDGSVNAVAKGIIGTDAALGIIPVGSGNGLANFLKIPKQIKGAIDIINDGQIRKVDTLLVNDERVVSIAGLGYDALVAEKMKKASIRGFTAYIHIAIHEFIRYKPKSYTIYCNGEKIKKKALFIAFANSNQFGYNLPIIPDANISDGLMHICIVEKPPIALISYVGFHLFFMHRENATRFIRIIPTTEAKISQRIGRVMNIDGEAVKMPRSISVKVDPKSLNLLML